MVAGLGRIQRLTAENDSLEDRESPSCGSLHASIAVFDHLRNEEVARRDVGRLLVTIGRPPGPRYRSQPRVTT